MDQLISLDYLNERIKYFSYGNMVSNKCIQKFTPTLFDNKYFQCSASEMHCLIKFLSLIVGDLVPSNNQAWKVYIQLRKITCILLKTCFTSNDLQKFDDLIKIHLKDYINLSNEQLKPKFHFLLHYKV